MSWALFGSTRTTESSYQTTNNTDYNTTNTEQSFDNRQTSYIPTFAFAPTVVLNNDAPEGFNSTGEEVGQNVATLRSLQTDDESKATYTREPEAEKVPESSAAEMLKESTGGVSNIVIAGGVAVVALVAIIGVVASR